MLFEALLWNTQKYTCLTGLKSVLIFTCFPNIDSWEWKLSIDTTSKSNQSTEIQNSSIQWFALFVFVCFFFFPVDRSTNCNKPYRWKEYGVGYLVQTFLKLVENYLTENIQVEFFFSFEQMFKLACTDCAAYTKHLWLSLFSNNTFCLYLLFPLSTFCPSLQQDMLFSKWFCTWSDFCLNLLTSALKIDICIEFIIVEHKISFDMK